MLGSTIKSIGIWGGLQPNSMVGVGLWIEVPSLVLAPLLIPDASVHYRCLYGVKARLYYVTFPATHDLGGGTDIPLLLSSIVVKKLPLERIYKRPDSPLPLPCIILTPQRVMAPPTAGVTDRDDYLRPVLVTMVMADNTEPTLQVNLDIMSLWQ
jgi:hypothetical protein